MSRQIRLVVGVSVLIAVLGSPIGFARTHAAVQRGWVAVAAIALVGTVAALGMTPRRAPIDTTVADLDRNEELAAPIFAADPTPDVAGA